MLLFDIEIKNSVNEKRLYIIIIKRYNLCIVKKSQLKKILFSVLFKV